MKKTVNLEQDEKEILEAIESGAWKAVSDKRKLSKYSQIARNTLRKDQRMNIRISKHDMSAVKAKAAEEGVPYQTLVTSIIHKYVSGGLEVSTPKTEIHNNYKQNISIINLKEESFRSIISRIER